MSAGAKYVTVLGHNKDNILRSTRRCENNIAIIDNPPTDSGFASESGRPKLARMDMDEESSSFTKPKKVNKIINVQNVQPILLSNSFGLLPNEIIVQNKQIEPKSSKTVPQLKPKQHNQQNNKKSPLT